jgi:hypothetical protein
MPHTIVLSKLNEDFNPIDWEFNNDRQTIQKTSLIVRIYRKIVDCFNSQTKWVRAAEMVDLHCRHKLENTQSINPEEYQNILAIGKDIQKKLIREKLGSPSKQIIKARSLLDRQLVALNMRLTASNSSVASIFKTSTSDKDLELLKEKVINELKSDKHFWCADFHQKDVTRETLWVDKEWEKIEGQLSKIEGLTGLLLNHQEHLDDFITWVLRDNGPVDVFAGFPTIIDILKPTYAAARIGRATASNTTHLLHIQRAAGEYYVTLPVETSHDTYQRVPLLPTGKIHLRNNVETTLKKLAEDFVRRYDDHVPPYQMNSNGLTLFHTHQVAIAANDFKETPKNALEKIVAETSDDWWTKLPVYEKISCAEAEKRCKGLEKGAPSGLVLHGAVDNGNCDIIGTHGYIEVLIKNPDNDSYKVYSFGRTARNAPHGALQETLFFTNTVHARICTGVDQNEELSNRQNWGVGFALNPEQTQNLKNIVYTYVKKGLNDQLPFSLISNNCHEFAFKVAKKVLGVERKKDLEELMVLRWSEDLFGKGSSHPLVHRLMTYCKGSPDQKSTIADRVKKSMWWLGGCRELKLKKKDKDKTYSIINSNRMFSEKNKEFRGVYVPPKIRELILKYQQPVYIERNRAYCSDGPSLLDKIRAERETSSIS